MSLKENKRGNLQSISILFLFSSPFSLNSLGMCPWGNTENISLSVSSQVLLSHQDGATGKLGNKIEEQLCPRKAKSGQISLAKQFRIQLSIFGKLSSYQLSFTKCELFHFPEMCSLWFLLVFVCVCVCMCVCVCVFMYALRSKQIQNR